MKPRSRAKFPPHRTSLWLAACLGLSVLAAAPRPALMGAERAPKKLIEFGWDEPDTAFLREHIVEMQPTPFDGCVFHVTYTRPGAGQGNFTWEGWGTRTFTRAELKPAVDELKATPFRRFKSNFLRFNTTPAKLDWFDDYSAVATNACLAAWAAREGGCPGVLFDIEQYEGPLFDYHQQRDCQEKSWELYAAQARKRGSEVMQAFQEGFPDLQIFLTFGYCLPWAESRGGRRALAECHYGLLAPFLDGMLRTAAGHTQLIDGHESSYGYRDVTRFPDAYQTMKSGLLPIVADPEAYARVFSFSFGVWLDNNWRKVGWETSDLTKNYYSPEAFRDTVSQALATADEYVWIYTETPRWWSKEGSAVNLPQPYIRALQSAREQTIDLKPADSISR